MQEILADTSLPFSDLGIQVEDSSNVSHDTLQAAPRAFPSLFRSITSSDTIEPRPIPGVEQPSWVSLVMIGGFILFAWARLFYRHRMGLVIRGIFAKNYANQLSRDGNIFNERIGLVLFVVYLASISMFVFQALPLFDVYIGLPPILVYLSILAFFYGFWLIKSLLVQTLSWLFSTGEYSRDLLMNMYLYNLFAGILLLPLVSLMAYADRTIFFFITLIIIGLIYILRFFREAMIGIGFNKFSVFHLILYLCTLEILPLIVLAKILSRNMIL